MSITAKFSNGTILTGLEQNGDCLVSKAPVTPEMIQDGLHKVIFSSDGEGFEPAGRYYAGEHSNMIFGDIFTVDGEYYFWLDEMSPEELNRLKNRADIDYLALMTGVDL